MTPIEAFRDAIWKANNGYIEIEYLLGGANECFSLAQMIRRNKKLYILERNNQYIRIAVSPKHILRRPTATGFTLAVSCEAIPTEASGH